MSYVNPVLVALSVLILSQSSVAAELRQWTTVDGRFSTEAKLIYYTDDSVRLEKSNGKTVTVPRTKLSESDIAHLGELSDYTYRIPGKLSIQSPGLGATWAVEQSKESKEGWSIRLAADSPTRAFLLKFYCDPLRAVPSEEQRQMLAMDTAEAIMASLSDKFKFSGWKSQETKVDDQSVWIVGTILQRKIDKAEMVLMVTSFVRDQRLYQTSCLTNKKFDLFSVEDRQKIEMISLTAKQLDE